MRRHSWALKAESSEPTWGTGYNQQVALVDSDMSIDYRTACKNQFIVDSDNVSNTKPRIGYDAASGYGGNWSSSADSGMPIDRFFCVCYNQAF